MIYNECEIFNIDNPTLVTCNNFAKLPVKKIDCKLSQLMKNED